MSNRDPSKDLETGSVKATEGTPLPIFAGLAVMTVAGLVLLYFALSGGGSSGRIPVTATTGLHAGLSTNEPTPEATIDLNRAQAAAEPQQLNLSGVGQGDRFIIAQFGVDAPLTYRRVGRDGQMPNPDGPDDVSYYDFTEWPGMGGGPGKGGNSVYAGHVDSGAKACKNGTIPPPCQAVLWDLNRLRLGDEIQVLLGGQRYKYRVTSNQPVSAENGPWDKIVTATAEETLTVITCGGDFNRETRSYSNRQVVTAVRQG